MAIRVALQHWLQYIKNISLKHLLRIFLLYNLLSLKKYIVCTVAKR